LNNKLITNWVQGSPFIDYGNEFNSSLLSDATRIAQTYSFQNVAGFSNKLLI